MQMKWKIFLMSLFMTFVLVGCGTTDSSSNENETEVETETESESTEILQEELETEDDEIVIKEETYNIYDENTRLYFKMYVVDGEEMLKVQISFISDKISLAIYEYTLVMSLYQSGLEHDEYDIEIATICNSEDETLFLTENYCIGSSGILSSKDLSQMLTDSILEEDFDMEKFETDFTNAFNDFCTVEE
jgi:hypothetical protein